MNTMASNFDFDDGGSSPSPPRLQTAGRSKGCLVAAIVVIIFVIAFFLLLIAFFGGFSPTKREISATKASFRGKVVSIDPIRNDPVGDSYRPRHHVVIDFEAPAPGWDAASERN